MVSVRHGRTCQEEHRGVRAGHAGHPRRRSVRLRARLVAADLVSWMAGLVVAIEMMDPHRWRTDALATLGLCAVLTLCGVGSVAAYRLYLSRVASVRSIELSRLVQACAIVAVASGWVYRGVHAGLPVPVDVAAAILAFTFMASLRSVYAGWLRTCRVRGLFVRPVCVLGRNEDASALVRVLDDQPELGYRVTAIVDEPARWASAEGSPRRRSLAEVVRETGATGVIVAANAVDPVDLDCLVRELITAGLHVQVSTGLARIGHHRVRPSPLANQTLLYVEHRRHSRGQRIAKRILDLILASVVGVLITPVLTFAAIAIKLEDGHSVLYRQERVGRDGKHFFVLKLRTMRPDAGAMIGDLAQLNERDGPLFKLSNDPRVTRAGRFLRSTSVDELPQLWNVIKGEMSLVGPRPALPAEVEKFDSELRMRTSVLPGITGLWQVEARDNPSFDAYRRLDLFYVENWSVQMDVFVLCATAVSVVSRGLRSFRAGEKPEATGSGEAAGPMVPVAILHPADVPALLGAEQTA